MNSYSSFQLRQREVKVFSYIFFIERAYIFDLYIILSMLFHHVWLEIPALFDILKECFFSYCTVVKICCRHIWNFSANALECIAQFVLILLCFKGLGKQFF